MGGGIHHSDTRDIEDRCPWCDKALRVKSEEWTGGPDGFTAHVSCWGCDMRGPDVPYVYETEDEAVDMAGRLWRREDGAMKEFRGSK